MSDPGNKSRYPIDFSVDEINEEIQSNLDWLAEKERMSLLAMRKYVQITLGQTELQSRYSLRVSKLTFTFSWVAIAVSLVAIVFSGWVAFSTSRDLDHWRTDQISMLQTIENSLASITRSDAAISSTSLKALASWRDEQLSVLRDINKNLSFIVEPIDEPN